MVKINHWNKGSYSIISDESWKFTDGQNIGGTFCRRDIEIGDEVFLEFHSLHLVRLYLLRLVGSYKKITIKPEVSFLPGEYTVKRQKWIIVRTVLSAVLLTGFCFSSTVLFGQGKHQKKRSSVKRPQEPEAPLPYEEEELKIQSIDDIKLSGTLTIPEEGKPPFPGVILISGSGPQDRNETVAGHKPFLVIADYLTRHGIAVLRYDDRGAGKSTGTYQTSTPSDLARDAEHVFRALRKRDYIDSGHTGIIGHSEGGVIAPMVARNTEVSFIVTLAGPVLPRDKIVLDQVKRSARRQGLDDEFVEKQQEIFSLIFDFIKDNRSRTFIKKKVNKKLKQYTSKQKKMMGMTRNGTERLIKKLTTPMYRHSIKNDPITALRKINCPVLALFGGLDNQVLPKRNLAALNKMIQKEHKTNFTIKKFTGKNHLFQEAETGFPSEYAKIEQTVSPDVLQYITDWIKQRE